MDKVVAFIILLALLDADSEECDDVGVGPDLLHDHHLLEQVAHLK